MCFFLQILGPIDVVFLIILYCRVKQRKVKPALLVIIFYWKRQLSSIQLSFSNHQSFDCFFLCLAFSSISLRFFLILILCAHGTQMFLKEVIEDERRRAERRAQVCSVFMTICHVSTSWSSHCCLKDLFVLSNFRWRLTFSSLPPFPLLFLRLYLITFCVTCAMRFQGIRREFELWNKQFWH